MICQVMVHSFDAEDEAILVNEYYVNQADPETRKWIGRTITWAVNSGHGVQIRAAPLPAGRDIFIPDFKAKMNGNTR